MGPEKANVKLLITHFCPADKNMQYVQMAYLDECGFRSLERQRLAREHKRAVKPLEQQVVLQEAAREACRFEPQRFSDDK